MTKQVQLSAAGSSDMSAMLTPARPRASATPDDPGLLGTVGRVLLTARARRAGQADLSSARADPPAILPGLEIGAVAGAAAPAPRPGAG